jgi:hypothetical protein
VALSLEAVLAHVCLGRVVHLDLTREQKKALRDADGHLALDVLRHLLGAREPAMKGTPPERFPCVAFCFQAVAAKIGKPVGQKRARALVRRLIDADIIEVAGQYRQPYRNTGTRSGFQVTLYRVAGGLLSLLKSKHPVGKRPSVKRSERRRWWAHPLFGDLYGLPPPGIPRARLRRMRSADERFEFSH